MPTLKTIKTKLSKLNDAQAKKHAELMTKAKSVFETLMESKKVQVMVLVSRVENSTDLTNVEHDEYFHQWVREDFSSLIDTNDELERQLLTEYLSENYCVYPDYQNDCVTMSQGPCIIINHKGEVLDQDSGKWILDKNDYQDETDRNKQIEEHMEKTGYFPSVVTVDYHGNAYYLNTQVKE